MKRQKGITLLAIETSCDETAAAVVGGPREGGAYPRVLANIVSSQIPLHERYGGVVPEVAARAHVERIIPVIRLALTRAFRNSGSQSPQATGMSGKKILPYLDKIDAIAATYGPGLMTSLMVGLTTAKTLVTLLRLPFVVVNHLEGHVAANFVGLSTRRSPQATPRSGTIQFPALALIVSGGHTELVRMRALGEYELIGQTRDDAAGEAFDKIGKLLGLDYPAGPKIAALAENGDPKAFTFPRPMMDSPDFDFSFSGLKTALRYFLAKEQAIDKGRRADIAASVQAAIVEVLIEKTVRAAESHRVQSVLLAGGVAANRLLRTKLGDALAKRLPGALYHIPSLDLCTDNAAMIGIAGYFAYRKGRIVRNGMTVDVEPSAALAADTYRNL
ncbi:MAG: tRNA (adenosine(37)-N6)-threonylcarbamoyltransferase complex transferase subunit TsaD [Parcubacteria group bacterium]|nr:tRNA (adenosine(37)-N6)-threonylcarbamoyltransferase complex transferase subunit TsaD [Parcubacteria group bacterium]